MQLNLGKRIRELRKRDGVTQETLAEALGVTSQAVSRWEANGSYPDMEMVPAIANYFGVSIDELFGYDNNRETKINCILEKVNSFGIKGRSDDAWVEECLFVLREGLAEFPKNERLMLALADTLSEAGWRTHKEQLYYDEKGFIRKDYDYHKKNEHWLEAIKICEHLVGNAADNCIVTKAITLLVSLYRNLGENDKAVNYAKMMPTLDNCQEILLASATDGKQQAQFVGDFLLKAAEAFSEQLIYGLMANRNHYNSDMPIEKIKGVIALFELICDDGNLGPYHSSVVKLYLYLSRVQWERGYHDDTFISLDEALKHAKKFDAICDDEEHAFTAPLVSFVRFRLEKADDIAPCLPDDWPFWCNPDYSDVEKGIKADSRWNEWVSRTQA